MQAQVDGLLRVIAKCGAAVSKTQPAAVNNVIAFSGGVDSSLAAALVARVFPLNTAACLGVSPSLSSHQLAQARRVAGEIGIQLWEHATTEGGHRGYVENKGKSCYYCKTTLYETIQQATQYAVERVYGSTDVDRDNVRVVMYNGTNADDLKDPTRVGLVAAREYDVVSPLEMLTKTQVRVMAKYLGLSNWNAAASPCLRSRLEFGVEATQKHLRQVEEAEAFVRKTLQLQPEANMRVRFLAGQRGAVEIDAARLAEAIDMAPIISTSLKELGFTNVEIRPFKTGSLSGFALMEKAVVHTPARSL